ncbi:putative membrane protein [Escherichia coli DEC10F]|nr:putative membrane protein [Escherichia coli DEC10F]EHX01026.1 putative membrane protein [Escherichia coli DEC10F]
MESPISALVLVIFNIWSLADGTTLIVFPSIDLLFLSVI